MNTRTVFPFLALVVLFFTLLACSLPTDLFAGEGPYDGPKPDYRATQQAIDAKATAEAPKPEVEFVPPVVISFVLQQDGNITYWIEDKCQCLITSSTNIGIIWQSAGREIYYKNANAFLWSAPFQDLIGYAQPGDKVFWGNTTDMNTHYNIMSEVLYIRHIVIDSHVDVRGGVVYRQVELTEGEIEIIFESTEGSNWYKVK